MRMSRCFGNIFLTTIAALILLVSSARSLDGLLVGLLLHLHGSDPTSTLGRFISPLGDINNDGFSDIAVSSYTPRATLVYLGGNSPDTLPDASLRFGDIDGVHDYDGDGINDVSIVTYDSTWLIYKGFGDSLGTMPIDSIWIPQSGGKTKFIQGGYVNPDSYADYIVSSWAVEAGSEKIRYFESPALNKSVVWTYTEPIGPHDLRGFGFIDFNCDSISDIYIGLLPGLDSVGLVKIFYGPTFDSLPDRVIAAPLGFDSLNYRRFIESCNNIGDVDGDGCDDLYIQFEFTGLIYSGGTPPDTLPDYVLNRRSGIASNAGDINGDGSSDLIVENQDRSMLGAIDLYLGGAVFDTLEDTFIVKSDLPPFLQDKIGYRLSQAGDFNDDGFDDFMFSSENFAGGDQGDLWIVAGNVDIATDVEEEETGVLPSGFQLEQNHPNPFNPSTTIAFSIPRTTDIRLTVYNILGREVITLSQGVHSAGRYEVIWDGKDNSGHLVSSGVYTYRLSSQESSESRKMVFLK